MTEEREQRIDWVCERTGSCAVTRDADAHWDVDEQDWVLKVVQDQAYSPEGQTHLAEVPVILAQGKADDIHAWLVHSFKPDEWSVEQLHLFMKVLAWRAKELDT